MLATKTPIRYLRLSKEYIATLPTGEELATKTRPEAEWAYLSAVAPKLADKARKSAQNAPQFADRILRAALLVIEGHVTLTPGKFTINHRGQQTFELATVQSSDGTCDYTVYNYLGGLACNCKDGCPPEGAAGAPKSKHSDHTCKHIIAALLAE